MKSLTITSLLRLYRQSYSSVLTCYLFELDISLALETQKELLKEAGFRNIEIIWQVENKIIMVAEV